MEKILRAGYAHDIIKAFPPMRWKKIPGKLLKSEPRELRGAEPVGKTMGPEGEHALAPSSLQFSAKFS
jgi:hypothetical protein